MIYIIINIRERHYTTSYKTCKQTLKYITYRYTFDRGEKRKDTNSGGTLIILMFVMMMMSMSMIRMMMSELTEKYIFIATDIDIKY